MRAGESRVILGFKIKQKTNLVSEGCNANFYAMYNYNIFSNIDYL